MVKFATMRLSSGRVLSKISIYFLCLFSVATYAAGITFIGDTRLIVNAAEQRKSVKVRNDTDYPFLLRSFIEDAESNERPRFYVTPELTRLEPGRSLELMTIRLSSEFPQDRESLCYIKGFFLPAMGTEKISGSVKLSYLIGIKLFYRPKGLEQFNAVQDRAEELKFQKTERGILIKNPTPYHLTFSQLVINGVKVDFEKHTELKRMIAPFAETEFLDVARENVKTSISWSLIDDFGNSTDSYHVDL